MDATVITLERTNDELRESAQLQTLGVEPAPTAARDLGEEPAQMNPDVQQKETQGDQHETVGGIVRRRPAAHLPGAPVAAFDAEATAVLSAGLARRPVQVDQNEDHPIGAALQAFGALGRGEYATDREFGREGRVRGAMEGVRRPIALVALAQRARAAGLASDRTGDFRR